MILLDRADYFKVAEPLKKVRINKLFARSVVEKHVSGTIYVDNHEDPRTFYIIHPYGMSLLFGDPGNEMFNTMFREYALNLNQIRENYEWMQAFPQDWDQTLKDLFADRLIKSSEDFGDQKSQFIELNTRVNFEFQFDSYFKFKQSRSPNDLSIVPVDENIFSRMEGSVVPSRFWDSSDDLCKMGIGFSAFENDQLVSTAFSSYIHGSELELGMETVKGFRGRGYAVAVCSALIDYCVENEYEPVWSCREENIESYNLALKLGFKPTLRLPYYRLCK